MSKRVKFGLYILGVLLIIAFAFWLGHVTHFGVWVDFAMGLVIGLVGSAVLSLGLESLDGD